MNKINKGINKTNVLFREEIGMRFLMFRKAIKKTLPQLASELKTGCEDIAAIEKGTVYPKVNYLHYLHGKYGLNINWLVGNIGEMFVEGPPPGLDLDYNFVLASPSSSDDAVSEKYLELMQLMQIPVIEKAMMEKLNEIKKCLKEEE
jgi:transcriptional regulator with XRE-family HTH domain